MRRYAGFGRRYSALATVMQPTNGRVPHHHRDLDFCLQRRGVELAGRRRETKKMETACSWVEGDAI
jgi:hypothetical protein